ESNDFIYDRIGELAQKHNSSRAQISLAWLFSKRYMSSAIVGIGNSAHLNDAVGSVSLKLTEDEIRYLEEPYTPRPTSI
ncbi:hypothetical protein K501DRAFT_202978, partial [Backusella circina FSU 941]